MSFFFLNVFLKIANLYQKIVKNYLTFLPNSPAAKLGLNLFKKVSMDVVKLISEPDIKKVINFYIENHEDIQDLQGIYKMMFLLQCIKETERLEGDIIELGSYKGGNAIMIAKFLKQIGSKKKVYACDTFEVIPNDDEFVGNPKGQGMYSDSNFDFVLKQIKKYKVNDKIFLLKGLFSDTLNDLNYKKFSLVFIDCNIYDSAKFAINFVYPKLVNDGILISYCYGIKKDSHSFWGEGIAVNEYLSSKPEKVIIDAIPFFQKGCKEPKLKNRQPMDKSSNYSEI